MTDAAALASTYIHHVIAYLLTYTVALRMIEHMVGIPTEALGPWESRGNGNYGNYIDENRNGNRNVGVRMEGNENPSTVLLIN